jgi:hypothetical protein
MGKALDSSLPADTLVDVRMLDRYGGVELPIDYLKIDTQGSELQVLRARGSS